jgi:hypothetical protein
VATGGPFRPSCSTYQQELRDGVLCAADPRDPRRASPDATRGELPVDLTVIYLRFQKKDAVLRESSRARPGASHGSQGPYSGETFPAVRGIYFGSACSAQCAR